MGSCSSKSYATIYLVAHNNKFVLCTSNLEKVRSLLYYENELDSNMQCVECYVKSNDLKFIHECEEQQQLMQRQISERLIYHPPSQHLEYDRILIPQITD